MKKWQYLNGLVFLLTLSACQPSAKKQAPASFLPAKELVRLNQLVYMNPLKDSLAAKAPGYEIVYQPAASVNGNYAFIAKRKDSLQYALVIRGSVIEFSNEGFQNFIVQDFNVFNQKKWDYADTVKEAYISRGTYLGFQNLLQLRDGATGLSLYDFISRRIPAHASLVVTGHSLGGNLAYPMAGFLQKKFGNGGKIRFQLISFGAPAAGNAAFVRDLEDKFPDAERYVIDRDIAPAFPDHSRVGEIAKILGLDRVLKIKGFELDASDLMSIAGELLEKVNVINASNKYVQSQRHLRSLRAVDTLAPATDLNAEALFRRAYLFHRIDAYAALLQQ